jgi:pyruvate formate lyase activating enzyme
VSPVPISNGALGDVAVSPLVVRSERLARLRSGELGSINSWELVTAVDGPGTRLTVFVNGCPLRCLYCQNPETWFMKDGTEVEASEIIARIARYTPIFRASGGGLTLSGGEILMQPAFAARVLRGAKELGVHTCLDTSGYLGHALTDAALADTDLVLLDVKSGDPETYRRATGAALEPTLEFGRRLAREGRVEVWVRFVLVPGLTDEWDNVEKVAEYVASLNELRAGTVTRVEILPFHQLGREKWHELGRAYALEETQPPSAELVERVRLQFRSRGVVTY